MEGGGGRGQGCLGDTNPVVHWRGRYTWGRARKLTGRPSPKAQMGPKCGSSHCPPKHTRVHTHAHRHPPECLHVSLPRMSSACDLVTASTKPAAARVNPGVGRGGLLTGPRASSWAVKAMVPRRTWGHTATPPNSSIFSQRIQILLPLLDFAPALPFARDAHPSPALPRPAVVEILCLGTLPPTPTPQPFYGPWLSFEISSTWEPKGPAPPWAWGGACGRGAWFPVAPSLCRPCPLPDHVFLTVALETHNTYNSTLGIGSHTPGSR